MKRSAEVGNKKQGVMGKTHNPLFFMAEPTGFEPAASGVTGRRYNQLNYGSAFTWWAEQGSNL